MSAPDVHLNVSDLDRSPAFYRDSLGVEAVAGGGAVRLGAVFLRGGGYRHDLKLTTRMRTRRAASPSPCEGSRSRTAFAPAPAAPAAVFRRDGLLWELGFGEAIAHMPDMKGLVDIATLLANPRREIHTLELSGGSASGPRDGDLGEVIDAPARAAYRARVDELVEAIEDARLAHDPVRAERAQLELAAIREQLESAYGLGGRVRRSGDPAERARSAVTARIRSAIRRLETANPRLASHLRNSVRTGTWCVYEPETAVAWQL